MDIENEILNIILKQNIFQSNILQEEGNHGVKVQSGRERSESTAVKYSFLPRMDFKPNTH